MLRTKDSWELSPKQPVYPTYLFKAQGMLWKRRPVSTHNRAMIIMNSQQLLPLLMLGPHKRDSQLWWERWAWLLVTDRFCGEQRRSLSCIPTVSPAGSKSEIRQKALLNSMRHKTKIMNPRILERHFYRRKGLPRVGRKGVKVGRVEHPQYITHICEITKEQNSLIIINNNKWYLNSKWENIPKIHKSKNARLAVPKHPGMGMFW